VTDNDTSLAGRYGPWALVAGASEGVGAAYARAMAERGLNVILLARRQTALDDLASSIRAAIGVQTRTVAVDLTEPDAMTRIVDATSGLDVGMLMYCAGADPDYQPFLENRMEAALAMVQLNCIMPMRLCHHFAQPMVQRGQGGIALLSSGAGLAGARNVVAYGASKAAEIALAEGLWAELHDEGVDVLTLVLGVTDTPALRRILAQRGMLSSPDDTTAIPGASTPEEVVADALAHLTNGPTWLVGERLREGSQKLRSLTRSDAVKAMLQMTEGNVMNTRVGSPRT
jgi:short-subunit dehydrogenase